ncbi:transcriptional regulator [Kaistella flava (ex Peng et al. 2021)]|uniref:Transcriptional regulator n=1 Tax=Kaistella flava (ex Peng et al. 2021) TaxID=2038776 RepID=A0A7M2Y5I2_9FLAO|nr:transcriptional regulator [Kaistella flava (ex Peng et al. 2021)]QOW09508.1 transcriptional regulator [Kaistella flava (ex Peng et al. 2021)]
MKIKPIKTEQHYFEALERLEEIFDAKENTPDGDEAEILSLIIDNFENEHYPIEAPDPIEAIRIRMEEMDLKQKDMVEIIGSKSKTSEVLNRKKRLTLDMIRNLQEKLNLSASLLIKNYPIKN